jgi:hypothetical protein
MPAVHDVTVFEAVNNDLKEIYVASTTKQIFEAMSDLGKQLPAAISHWRPKGHSINFRSLEFHMSAEAARAFIARHTARPWPEGWKYIVEKH